MASEIHQFLTLPGIAGDEPAGYLLIRISCSGSGPYSKSHSASFSTQDS